MIWKDASISKGGLGRICEVIHGKALDCYDPIVEEVLVDLYLYGTIPKRPKDLFFDPF